MFLTVCVVKQLCERETGPVGSFSLSVPTRKSFKDKQTNSLCLFGALSLSHMLCHLIAWEVDVIPISQMRGAARGGTDLSR